MIFNNALPHKKTLYSACLLSLVTLSGVSIAAVPSARISNTQSIRPLNASAIYSTPTDSTTTASPTTAGTPIHNTASQNTTAVNASNSPSTSSPNFNYINNQNNNSVSTATSLPSSSSADQAARILGTVASSAAATSTTPTYSSTLANLSSNVSTSSLANSSAINSALNRNNTLNSTVKRAESNVQRGLKTINSLGSPYPDASMPSTAKVPSSIINGASNLAGGTLGNIPTPQVTISNIDFIPTVKIPTTRYSSGDTMDISLIDNFITELAPHARHYPPNFNSATERYNAKKLLQHYEEQLRPLAESPDASYDVLLRAAKLNGMARNLDLGSEYAVRGSTYIAKALERRPDSDEANFIYGLMLSEGGGFKEGKKYLDRAAANGYLEAEQSLAQTDLLTEKRSAALARLQRLQSQYPNNAELQQQIRIVQNGDYYIWDLPAD